MSGSERELLVWHVHLAARQGRKARAALAIVGVAVLLTQWALQSPLMTIGFGVVLFSAIADFILPQTFALTTRGARLRAWFKHQFIEWKDVRALHLDAHGLKLSPFARPSRLEPFRGVYLRFAGNQHEVVKCVETLAVNAAKANDGV